MCTVEERSMRHKTVSWILTHIQAILPTHEWLILSKIQIVWKLSIFKNYEHISGWVLFSSLYPYLIVKVGFL